MAASVELKAYITCSLLLYVKFMIAAAVRSVKNFEGDSQPQAVGTLPTMLWLSQRGIGQTADVATYSHQEAVAVATATAPAHEVEARWKRVIQDDLESVPLALVLFGAGVFAGGNTELFEITLALYTIARWFHMLALATAQQPQRVVAFWIGATATFVGAVNSLAGVYKS